MQLPLFVTVVMAVRRMAFQPIEGLETGGIAWFTDLTLPAITINSWNALIPMGNYGIILPVAVTGLTLANIDQAFSNPPGIDHLSVIPDARASVSHGKGLLRVLAVSTFAFLLL